MELFQQFNKLAKFDFFMDNFDKYSRQTALENFGEIGQTRLCAASVFLAGAGGVGCAVLEMLAAAGVGKICVADFDAVSASNLHRQTLFEFGQIGLQKAICAAMRAAAINPDSRVLPLNVKIGSDPQTDLRILEILKTADIAVDTCDNFAARAAFSKLCRAARVPMIMASAQEYVAQNVCFGTDFYFENFVDDSENAAYEKSESKPIFPPAAHLSGVLAAAKVLRALAGDFAQYSAGEFVQFDLLNQKFTHINLCAK